jgi:hypothetical protein
MSVIGDLHDIFRRLSGTWTTHIEHESTESLRLRYGRMRTEFRRAESQVLQDAKPVATYSQIEQVELG